MLLAEKRSESPIPYTKAMVQAILENRKRNTRRIINPQPQLCAGCQSCEFRCDHFIAPLKQKWKKESLLWVQENYSLRLTDRPQVVECHYEDGTHRTVELKDHEYHKLLQRRSPIEKKQPGRFMYKSCSRIWLKVKDVQVERLQEITEEGAIAEGVEDRVFGMPFYRDYLSKEGDYMGSSLWKFETPVDSFKSLWQSMHGAESWDRSDWVWVVEFERVEGAIASGGKS